MYNKNCIKLLETLGFVLRESVLISQISHFYLGNTKKHMSSCFTSCHKILEKKVVSKLSKGNISQKCFDLYSLQNQLTSFSHKLFFWLSFFYSEALVVKEKYQL